MRFKEIIAAICMLFHIYSVGQKDDEVMRQIVVNSKDSLIKATCTYYEKKSKNLKVNYYWFAENKIHINQGGYSGMPMHGWYEMFINNTNLIEKGKFRYGLKNGKWYRWSSKGTLIGEQTWKNGELHGPFKTIYESERKTIIGNYKNGKLHGKVKVIRQGKEDEIVKYKNGEVQLEKEKLEKEKKEETVKKDKSEKRKKREKEDDVKASTDEETKKDRKGIKLFWKTKSEKVQKEKKSKEKQKKD